jgi:hypothetical protein
LIASSSSRNPATTMRYHQATVGNKLSPGRTITTATHTLLQERQEVPQPLARTEPCRHQEYCTIQRCEIHPSPPGYRTAFVLQPEPGTITGERKCQKKQRWGKIPLCLPCLCFDKCLEIIDLRTQSVRCRKRNENPQ